MASRLNSVNGIAPVERHQVNLVAQGLEVGEVLAPGAVDDEEGEAALDLVEHGGADFALQRIPALGRALPQEVDGAAAVEDALAPVRDVAALALEHLGVVVEPAPDVEALAFDDALRARHLAPHHG